MAQNDSITDALRADILSGLFEPGERLVEQRLTNQYDCGRLAVRSALLELSAEGLVDREANRGALVRDVSITEAIQITQARAALETLIAGDAARHASESQRAELTAIGEHMANAVAVDDRAAYSRLNGELHQLLSDASGHTVAADLVVGLRNRGAQHRFRLASRPDRARESLPQHLAIIDAVVSGESEQSAAAMAAHLSSVVDVLQHWTDQDAGVPQG